MIACLGWGSLIWSPRNLPLAGDWLGDGPELPIEFSRVSADGRLTLAITEGAKPLTVLWAELKVSSIDRGVEALAEREGISERNFNSSIGLWSNSRCSRHKEANQVGDWASQRGIEAVIWTALKPGLEKDSRGVVPSLSDVLGYLHGTSSAVRARAEEYIRRAPAQIVTEYRAAIEQEFGWAPL
ncbi:hypothetical protein [Qipengyuania flava]|uniref:hypothetical protein n=1 Tax=Qipengyuania flava TaxID=192812 RepID=UPI00102E8D22|nr:hypothetical protein [Qipengyuania flava]